MRKEVERLLEEGIRSMLRSHGGDVRLLACQDGVATLELLGNCAGCPSADLSTRQAIEETLCGRIPALKEIVLYNPVDAELLEFARKLLRCEAEQ